MGVHWMSLRLFTLALAALAAGPSLAQAPQVLDATPPDRFNESYDVSAPVAGSPLVGLRLGDLEAAPNSITVIGPPSGDLGVCLRVTTKDGRFSSANNFGVSGDASGRLVRISPLTLQYQSQLRQYPAGEIAFRAFGTGSAEECVPAHAVNLPVLGSDAATAGRLVLFANGKSQPASAALYATDAVQPPADLQPLTKADCDPATGGTTVAYDLICRLDLPAGFSGRALLALEFSDGFSTDSYYYATLVPQLAKP